MADPIRFPNSTAGNGIPLPRDLLDTVARDDAIAALGMAAAVILHFQRNRDAIEKFAMLTVDMLDILDGDSECEEADPAECDGDGTDSAWIEWSTMRGSQKRGPNFLAGHEDAEDDDPAEQDDHGGDEHDGREPDEDGY